MNEPRLKYGAMSWYSQSPVSPPSGIMIIRVNSIDLYGAIYEPISRSNPENKFWVMATLNFWTKFMATDSVAYWVEESVSEIWK